MQLKEVIKYPFERLLARLEDRLIAGEAELTYRPIFIVAPARSGSTLVYQAMTRYFDLCYFSNSMTRFPESPVCSAYLLARLGGCNPPENFRSHRGYVEGGRGPTDASKIWAQWFPEEPQYTPNGVLTLSQQRELRATISCFQRAFGAPFINKTQRNCGRIRALAEIFPEAVFVRLHRNLFDMVLSRWQLYKSRTDENRLWQSYRPSNCVEIVTDDPIEHLCQQVVFTEADIARDRRAIGSEEFFDIEYSEFCQRPAETLESFAKFYASRVGWPALKKRHDIPQSFECKRTAQVAADEERTIRAHLERQQVMWIGGSLYPTRI
jgi:hypothetical protein